MILITGGNGFIGRAVSDVLFEKGYKFKSIVRMASDNNTKHSKYSCQQLDLSVNDAINKIDFDKVDIVIHLAAVAHKKDALKTEIQHLNRDVSIELAEAAFKYGCSRFIFLSTVNVFSSVCGVVFNETGLTSPVDFSAQAKLDVEKAILDLANLYQTETVIIRPPLVYGPNVKSNFASMISWVNKGVPLPFGSVNNKRSFVALDNLVDFILLCADKSKSPKAANQVFLISDGEDVSTTTLLRKVARAYGARARLLPVPVSFMRLAAKLFGKSDVADRLFGNLQVDSSKARELLGWRPVVTMDEQLRKISEFDKTVDRL